MPLNRVRSYHSGRIAFAPPHNCIFDFEARLNPFALIDLEESELLAANLMFF